ncbi:hypothetical protein [Streptomyces sp. NBC_00035]|uniref:hypothetical protein n=1 Tax=Streptomyces sp. NBC_00035 TaxID=2903614 RepID=UPI00324737DE
MAAVPVETADLEILVRTALTNPRAGIQVLSALRVANGEAAIPANYGVGDLSRPEDGAWRAALVGLAADQAA